MPLVAGTLTTSFVALALAVPVGTIAAIYLSEFASHKTRETVKPVLELLVGDSNCGIWLFCSLVRNSSFAKNYA